MTSEAMRRVIPFTLCTTYAFAFLACNPPTSSTEGQVQGVSSRDRLTSTEWATYRADGQYLREIAPANVSVRLNLADPRQYSFAMARLKLVGKNATNSPYLFELIEARRRAQIASGMKAGAFAPVAVTASHDAEEMHYIETAAVRNGTLTAAAAPGANAAPPRYAIGTASSTFPGGSDFTSVDISISTIAGDPLGDVGYKEDWENPNGNTGANVTISTTGNPNISSFTRYTFESFKYEAVGDEFNEHYFHTEIGSTVPKTPAALPQLSVPVIDDPRDIRGPNGVPDMLISACMDRTWTNDCDYEVNTGSVTDHRIKLPVKGSIALTTTAYVFDALAIQALKNALNHPPDPLPISPGHVKLVLANVGGGCNVDATGALYSPMAEFWNTVILAPDNRSLTWDATGVNALYFAEGCSQVQNFAKFTMFIPLPVLAQQGGISFTIAFTVSNDPDALRPDFTLLPLTLTNSCLAAGTQIELSTGTLAAVESLHIGQSIFNPYAANDHSLTITDTASGTEASPMVRIRDEAGHTLLMTEMHPIATPDRGMVQARALRTGDIVTTTQGPSRLSEVSRESYTGKVYNLKVGSEAQMASLGQDQTVVHANGFVVGDGQIQSKYEVQSQKQGRRTTIEQVPERWRQDYLFSSARK